jgi:long-subunit acyl-CoA synthetase (AMP-forming)
MLNEAARKTGKNSFELAKNCRVQGESFANKDMLSNTFKLMRHKARQVFKDEIANMYKEGELK